jgi:hypothetical protein
MLNWQGWFRRAENVVGKLMDDEAVIINLSNGMYYSLDKVGGVVWEMIDRGHTLQDILAILADRYQVTTERARGDLERIVTELSRENLIAEASGPAPAVRDQEASAPRSPYEPPALHCYRDMSDLLALDPPAPSLADTPWKEPGSAD